MWHEQEAAENWWDKNSLALKHAVSSYRIELQSRLDKAHELLGECLPYLPGSGDGGGYKPKRLYERVCRFIPTGGEDAERETPADARGDNG